MANTMADAQYGTVPGRSSGGIRRANSHFDIPDDKSYEKLNGIAPVNVHNAFVRKVYGLLAVELAFTAAISAVITLVPAIRIPLVSFATNYHITYEILLFVGLLGSLCWLMVVQKQWPINMYAMATFVFFMSIDVGWTCAVYYESGQGAIILIAVGITTVIFVSLSLYAWMTTTDFNYLAGFLFAATMGLLLVGLVQIFFRMEALYYLYCCLGIVIFSAWVIFDTAMIKEKLGPDDAMVASIQLYLDVINLFLFILSLLGDRK
jgi:hypothetical protein